MNGKNRFKSVRNGCLAIMLYSILSASRALGEAPVIQEGGVTNIVMSEDGDPTAFTLQLSAIDADLDPLNWSISLTPTNGSAAISPATGEVVNVTYDPVADYNGSDMFHVRVNDGHGGSDEMVITVTILLVNDPPFLVANTGLQIAQLEHKTITAAHLAADDVDTNDMSSIYFELNASTRVGQLMLSGIPLNRGDHITQQEIDDGLLSYSVPLTAQGSDDFSYSVYDAEGAVASDGPWTNFTFPIIILFTNLPPTAIDDSTTTGLGIQITNQFSATDSNLPPQDLTFRIVQDGTKGYAQLLDASTGRFTYIYTNSQAGVDEIWFQVNDGISDAAEPGVFTISASNQAPQPESLSITSVHGQVVSQTLHATDPDRPPQPLTYEIVQNGMRGTAVITDTATGAFTYTPHVGRFGLDRFSFRVNDGLTNSPACEVDVTITHVPVDGDLLIARKLKQGDDIRVGSVLVADAATGDAVDLSYGGELFDPNGVVFHRGRLSVFVSDGAGATPPRILEINLFDGGQRIVSEGGFLGFPIGINVDNHGDLIVCDIASASVLRINPETGTQSKVASGGELQVPAGVEPLPDGSMYIIDAMNPQAPDGKLLLLETNGVQSVISTNGNLVVPIDLTLVGTGTVFVTDVAGMVIAIDVETGNQTVVASGVNMPVGIDTIGGSSVFIATSYSYAPKASNGQILRMDAASHATQALGDEIAHAELWGLSVVPAMGWIRDFAIVPDGLNISWHSPSGQVYRVESATNLLDPLWHEEATVVGDGGWISRTITNKAATCLFLRCVPVQ